QPQPAYVPPYVDPYAQQYPQQTYPQASQYPDAQQHYAMGYPPYTQQTYPQQSPADSGTIIGTSNDRAIPDANATVGVSNRVRFIRLTYLHLLSSILTSAGLLYLFMTNEFLAEHVSVPLVKFALGGRWNWGVVLAAFMGVSYVADKWSHADSRGTQYAGLL